MDSSTDIRATIASGNEMIARGAVQAGCRFFAGYPITPASGIYRKMIELLQERGDLALSAPDEISALAYCVGASMRGVKAMTATSGPGWALMIETVQYALMTETPLVIALVQRLGPSTGGATQGAQGDVLFAEFCTSGGYTIPVLCPSTPVECFELTMLAFSWAEILRMPVILLTDKEVAMTTGRVEFGRLLNLRSAERERVAPASNGSNGHKMYDFARPDEIPPFVPVGEAWKATATGSAHNKSGELKKNDGETLEVLKHLEEKVAHRRDGLVVLKRDCEPAAETLILSYGITARAMAEAVAAARRLGKRVSAINLLTLFPIPERQILQAAAAVRRVVVAEENFSGQYRSLLGGLLKDKEVIGVNKIGSMITPGEILEAIR
jgi:2-oxoglutarate ferredoxin oxidoreductase subunit alpha